MARTKQEMFDRDVDNYCRLAVKNRPRCREWVEFSRPYLERYEAWNGCWVAQVAVQEWELYMQTPQGEYVAPVFPEGSSFRR